MAIYDANDNILMRFQYADSRLPVAMQSGGATYYLAYDQVGSLRIVTDATGTVIKALDYDSFGSLIQDTNPSFDMPFGFAGGLYDPDTGLIKFGFREYSPEIGRWTAKDPILFLGGDADLYGYCLNDPINFNDLIGLSACLEAGLGAAKALITPGGPGQITGMIVGAVVGGYYGGIPGGIAGSLLLGMIGSIFDPVGAGELGYGEQGEIEHYRRMQEIEDLNKWVKQMRKDLEPIAKKLHVKVTPCETCP